MAELPPASDTQDDASDPSRQPDGRPAPGTPRWVKVFAITALALIVLFVVLHLAGGGFGGHAP